MFGIGLAIVISVFVIIFIGTAVWVAGRYVKCEPDQMLVIYGKVGSKKDPSGKKAMNSAQCIHGGAQMVWPVIQGYNFLDLKPMDIDINLKQALSAENIRVNAPSTFTIQISTDEDTIGNAAKSLLGLTIGEIKEQANNIIFGQFRATIAVMKIKEINMDRVKFQHLVMESTDQELRKIGLEIVNVNIKDIQDESGYILELGKQAAAKVVNQARIDVAEEEKNGAVGIANAERDQEIQVANAERDRMVQVSDAEKVRDIGVAANEADAVKGRNEAKIIEEQSDSDLRQKKAIFIADAEKKELVASAEAKKEGFIAEAEAEEKRKERDTAKELADTIPQALAAKEKTIIDAQADAKKEELEGEGEGNKEKAKQTGFAAGILAIATAEAEGIEKKLTAQGDGLKTIVTAAGSADSAFSLLMIDKLEIVADIQAKAISGIKVDSLTMIDSGDGSGIVKHATNLMSILPPMINVAKNAGVNLPAVFGNLMTQAEIEELPNETISAEEVTKPEEVINLDNEDKE